MSLSHILKSKIAPKVGLGLGVMLAFSVAGIPSVYAATGALPSSLETPPAVNTDAVPLLFSGHLKAVLPAVFPPPPELPNARSYVLMDFKTGEVIASKNPHFKLPPASLTKLMTAYLTYQALGDDLLTLNQQIPVSTQAWQTGGSSMFIQPGLPVTVEQLLKGLMIDSGNDAAVALAQAIAGSTSSFVGLMNQTAVELGLTDTHYSDVDGLPDAGLYTSAADVAKISRALLLHYPQITKISDIQYYTYNKITQQNWNPVLFRDPTVDGLKTGLTNASGHCIDATAVRKGRRLIAVVMGTPSWAVGTNDIEVLLDYGYRFTKNETVFRAGEQVGTFTDPSLSPTVIPVGVAQDLLMTLPTGPELTLSAKVHVTANLQNPITKGEVIGTVDVLLNNQVIKTVPAIALANAQRAGLLQKLESYL